MFAVLNMWNYKRDEARRHVDDMKDDSNTMVQADAITSFMHKGGENRSAQFHAAFVRGSVATASQEAAEITGVQ